MMAVTEPDGRRKGATALRYMDIDGHDEERTARMIRTFDTLGKKKVVIGMVHLLPLPGTPFYQEGTLEQTLDKAVADATALYQGGADGCLIQTVDRVYPAADEADYARVAAMAMVTKAVADATGPEFQIGVQIMLNALKASVAVAKVCGGSFIRCTALVGATVSAAGMVEAHPHDFLSYRARIGAQQVKLIAEVNSRHFRWLGIRPRLTSPAWLRAWARMRWRWPIQTKPPMLDWCGRSNRPCRICRSFWGAYDA